MENKISSKQYQLIFYILFFAMLIGYLSAIRILLVFALISILIFILLLTKPTITFFLWIIFSPFLQGHVINLGKNIPDLSLDRVLIIALFIGVLLSLLNLKKANIHLDFEDISILIFLIGCFVSIIIWKPIDIPQQILLVINQFILGFLFFFSIKKSLFIKRKRELYFFACVIILFIFSIPAIAEEITGLNIFGNPSEIAGGAIRAQTFFRTAWEFGIYCILFLPFTFRFFLYSDNKYKKYFSLLSFISGICGIVLCFMRGSWFALIVILIILFIFEKRSRKILLICGVIIIGLLAINYRQFISSEIFTNRILNTDNLIGRRNLIEQQIDVIKLHPLFGNGLNPTFNKYFFGTTYNYNASFTYSTIPHNSLISMFVDLGLFCLFYYFPILVILIRKLIEIVSLKNENKKKLILLSLFCSAIGYFIQSLTFEARLFSGANIFFWGIMGFLSIQ